MQFLPLHLLVLLFAPLAANGQTAVGEVNRVFSIFETVLSSFQTLVAIAVTLAFLLFFWNIAMFIRVKGSEGSKAEDAKNKLFWSIVAIFVLTSVWGIVFFLFRVFIGDPGASRDVGETGIPIEILRLPVDQEGETKGSDRTGGDGGSPEVGDGGSPEVGDGGSPEVGDGGSPEVGDGGSPEVGDGGSPEVGDGGSPEVGGGTTEQVREFTVITRIEVEGRENRFRVESKNDGLHYIFDPDQSYVLDPVQDAGHNKVWGELPSSTEENDCVQASIYLYTRRDEKKMQAFNWVGDC